MRKVAVLFAVCLVAGLLALLAGRELQRSLQEAGIEQLDWQQLRWRDDSLQLQQLSAVHVTERGRVRLHARQLSLRPVWRAGPRIDQLLVDELQLVWQPADKPPAADGDLRWDLPTLTDLSGPLQWLPQQVRIGRLQLQMPCEGEFCTLQGGLQLNSQQQPLAVDARLEMQEQERTLSARLQLREQDQRYRLQAELQLPEPLPLAGLGALSGRIELDLENHGDQWLLRQGQVHARLAQPQLALPAAVSEAWQPEALMLHLTPQPGNLADWQDRLQLALQLEMEGAITGQLQGDLALSVQTDWQAQLSVARLQLAAERLTMAAAELHGLTLDWPLQGLFNARQLSLTLAEPALLNINRLALAGDEVVLTGVQGRLGGSRLLLPLDAPDQLSLTSPLQLSVRQLQQSALKPQGWSLQGELQYAASGLRFGGDLVALSGLNSRVQLDWPTDQAWQLQLALGDIFLRAANPLAATFADWPALLSFSSGRITGQLRASGRDSLQRLSGQLSLTGGEGIYDRATFTGLSLPLAFSLQRDQLRLDTTGLTLISLDPGLELGPLQMRGSYAAHLQQLLDGTVELQAASLGILDGRIQLEPASINLGRPRQTLVAVVEGVELARLFEVYPAQGLSGRGTLDGRFPVSLVNGKLLIEDGRLQARQPGGVLRYQAEQLRSMAASNPNLEQLAAALDDFRYQVLASDVSYDEQGVLVLGLRLEGSNPAFQQGRQVNLNIRLEEDIPALLTSLQLSGQVSEIIRKRIEQRYLQRGNP